MVTLKQNVCPILLDNIGLAIQKSGGLSTMWSRLVSSLAQDDNFELTCLNRTEIADNIFYPDFMGLSYIESKDNQGLIRLAELNRIKINKPSIVHSSYFRYSTNQQAINVVTVHDFICKYYYTGVLKAFSFNQIKRAVLHADALVCISNNTYSDLIKFIPDAKNIPTKIVYNAFDNVGFVNHPNAQLKNQVVFVGVRNLAYKNFTLAVESTKATDDVKLVIIGAPATREEVKLLNENLPGRYEFVVYPSAEKMSRIFSESIALLYLSDYEGFGIPPLEAMASGTAVLVQNKSVFPEIVGDAAVLLDNVTPDFIAKQIIQLRDDSQLRKMHVDKGLYRSSMFSWDKMTSGYKNLYLELWQKRRK